jgi:hypothetical protein
MSDRLNNPMLSPSILQYKGMEESAIEALENLSRRYSIVTLSGRAGVGKTTMLISLGIEHFLRHGNVFILSQANDRVRRVAQLISEARMPDGALSELHLNQDFVLDQSLDALCPMADHFRLMEDPIVNQLRALGLTNNEIHKKIHTTNPDSCPYIINTNHIRDYSENAYSTRSRTLAVLTTERFLAKVKFSSFRESLYSKQRLADSLIIVDEVNGLFAPIELHIKISDNDTKVKGIEKFFRDNFIEDGHWYRKWVPANENPFSLTEDESILRRSIDERLKTIRSAVLGGKPYSEFETEVNLLNGVVSILDTGIFKKVNRRKGRVSIQGPPQIFRLLKLIMNWQGYSPPILMIDSLELMNTALYDTFLFWMTLVQKLTIFETRVKLLNHYFFQGTNEEAAVLLEGSTQNLYESLHTARNAQIPNVNANIFNIYDKRYQTYHVNIVDRAQPYEIWYVIGETDSHSYSRTKQVNLLTSRDPRDQQRLEFLNTQFAKFTRKQSQYISDHSKKIAIFTLPNNVEELTNLKLLDLHSSNPSKAFPSTQFDIFSFGLKQFGENFHTNYAAIFTFFDPVPRLQNDDFMDSYSQYCVANRKGFALNPETPIEARNVIWEFVLKDIIQTGGRARGLIPVYIYGNIFNLGEDIDKPIIEKILLKYGVKLQKITAL